MMKPLYEDEPLVAWRTIASVVQTLCFGFLGASFYWRENHVAGLAFSFVGLAALPWGIRPDARHPAEQVERKLAIGAIALVGGALLLGVMGDGSYAVLLVVSFGSVIYSWVDLAVYLVRRRAARVAQVAGK